MKERGNASKPAANSTFSKEQILNCNKYKNRQDLLSALLKPDKEYVLEDVDKVIQNFEKGVVVWH